MSNLHQDGENEPVFITQTQDLKASKPTNDTKENKDADDAEEVYFNQKELSEMTPPFFDLFNQGIRSACRHCNKQPCKKYEFMDFIENAAEEVAIAYPWLAPDEKRYKVYKQLALYRGWKRRKRHEPCIVATIRKIFARRPSDPAYKGHVYK